MRWVLRLLLLILLFAVGGVSGIMFNGYLLYDFLATVDGKQVLISDLASQSTDPEVFVKAYQSANAIYNFGGQTVVLPGYHWSLTLPLTVGIVFAAVGWLWVARSNRRGAPTAAD